jgi:hypothetical protein
VAWSLVVVFAAWGGVNARNICASAMFDVSKKDNKPKQHFLNTPPLLLSTMLGDVYHDRHHHLLPLAPLSHSNMQQKSAKENTLYYTG